MAEQHALDQKHNEDCTCPSDHQLNTCFNRDLSDGEQLRFNRALDDSPCNMWLRKEATIKIGRAKKRENVGPRHGIMAHLKRMIVAVQPFFIRSNGPRFSIKRCSSSL